MASVQTMGGSTDGQPDRVPPEEEPAMDEEAIRRMFAALCPELWGLEPPPQADTAREPPPVTGSEGVPDRDAT
jgi:hypothetical protein